MAFPCLEAYADTGNPASHWIGKGPNNIIPSSNESFHMVHGWLQTCLDSHELCVKPEIGFMPARLIKILENGGQFALRLQEKESGISHQYAALSYCWGGEQSLQTTTHNHARHQIEIDFDDLPPTLRDAVLTTHKLGLQYLWVDALCIIQDDERDKSSEIDIMSHVYTSAVVTIAASRAKSVQEGFLQDRSPHIRNNPIEFEMGWAFQERLSSTRLLEYGTFRTHWLCRTRCTSDRYSHSYDDYQLKLLWRDRFWSHSVDTFTHKQLTFQSDRLAAIAGVARRYQPIFKDDYLAGIWKSPLPYGLLWIVDTFAITSFEKRPEHYLAPSWSWAAVIQPVSTRVFDSSGSPVVQILDAKVDSNSTPAKYGAVREGQLKLRGFLTNATWTCSNYTNDIYSLGTMYADQGSHSTKYREMATHPDALETDLWDTDTHSISVYLLVLLVDAKVERVTGLILRKHEDGVYSRLGVFQSPCNDHGVKNNPNEARKFLQRQEQIVTIK
ncbi:heterokaryon incompatibility protein-domain-containing protein [Bisporella sp. PMI_857]|nr:heterokaryon incompatibility protein-domain-containing protein [Bisporella sp. PMI_857]